MLLQEADFERETTQILPRTEVEREPGMGQGQLLEKADYAPLTAQALLRSPYHCHCYPARCASETLHSCFDDAELERCQILASAHEP